MNAQRLTLALTAINLIVLLILLTVAQTKSTTAQPVAPILRARALELVDDHNVVRVRLNVKESELNLFDKNGIIRVKLGAAEWGSAMVLSEGGAEAPRGYIQIIARQSGTRELPTTTSLRLKTSDGRQRVITP